MIISYDLKSSKKKISAFVLKTIEYDIIKCVGKYCIIMATAFIVSLNCRLKQLNINFG